MLVGHAHGKAVLLVRTAGDVFAISPNCTHYNGPLAEGLIVDKTIRCPWHHACFDLRTGEAVRAPALHSIACWEVAEQAGWIKVGKKREQRQAKTRIDSISKPKQIVIVGGGAAGFAAAEMLRRVGYQNSLTMLSSDAALPYDRPNLSKDYLAGTIIAARIIGVSSKQDASLAWQVRALAYRISYPYKLAPALGPITEPGPWT